MIKSSADYAGRDGDHPDERSQVGMSGLRPEQRFERRSEASRQQVVRHVGGAAEDEDPQTNAHQRG
jgi:hypothetical protein